MKIFKSIMYSFFICQFIAACIGYKFELDDRIAIGILLLPIALVVSFIIALVKRIEIHNSKNAFYDYSEIVSDGEFGLDADGYPAALHRYSSRYHRTKY